MGMKEKRETKKSVKIVKKGKMREVRLEPDWEGMFRFAVQMVVDKVPEKEGRDFLVQMLEFGSRLYRSSVADIVMEDAKLDRLGKKLEAESK